MYSAWKGRGQQGTTSPCCWRAGEYEVLLATVPSKWTSKRSPTTYPRFIKADQTVLRTPFDPEKCFAYYDSKEKCDTTPRFQKNRRKGSDLWHLQRRPKFGHYSLLRFLWCSQKAHFRKDSNIQLTQIGFFSPTINHANRFKHSVLFRSISVCLQFGQ